MDPERLKELAALLARAREQGRSDREINSALRRNRNIPVNSVRQLEAEMRASGIELPTDPQEREGPLEEIQERLAPWIQGGTGSLASDLIGGLEKIGLAPEGAAENFRGDLQESREERPVRSTVAQLGGLLFGGPGKIAAKTTTAAGKAAANVGGRAGAGLARRLGGGELAQMTGAGAGRALGATTGAGAVGAAEGGLIGFGETAGEPAGERAVTGLLTSIPAGVITGAAGGVGSAVNTARRVGRARKAGGEMLADATVSEGGLLGTRAVERARGHIQQAARRAFRSAEGEYVIPEAFLTVAEDGTQATHPAVARVLRSSRTETSQGLLRRLDEYASGESIRPITFEEADNIRKQLKRQADALKRMLPDNATPADIFRVNEAQDALNFVEEALETIPGYEQGIRLHANQSSIRRAVDAGKKMRNQPAETVEALMRGEQVRVPGSKKPVQLGSVAERVAFVEGMAEPMVQKLRGGAGSVQGFLDEVFTGTEMKRKLRLVFGDEQAYQQFLSEAERVRAIGNASQLTEFGIKYAGFIGLGSSIAGGVGTTLLFD